ncbi:copper ion binding protein [Halobacteroides halobius DSM 5150]|uniref:Copper ion binding protein n=1 Tax=Halobacteroides halobius (strain ATCC 35273 / DSM 5150 / MD-1) TaxID=748449 RepID=L0K8R2_HALHC|nr:copper ion binding protein [Halobacteroides halobius]AGB40744.1 copper ion binding protein [Halobacteroides halobius DSM 5150]
MKEVLFNVEGMSCGHCKNSVETALNDLAGVNNATVDLDAATVTVKFDDTVSEADLKAAIEDAGSYQVK